MPSLCHLCTYDILRYAIALWRIDGLWTGYCFTWSGCAFVLVGTRRTQWGMDHIPLAITANDKTLILCNTDQSRNFITQWQTFTFVGWPSAASQKVICITPGRLGWGEASGVIHWEDKKVVVVVEPNWPTGITYCFLWLGKTPGCSGSPVLSPGLLRRSALSASPDDTWALLENVGVRRQQHT